MVSKSAIDFFQKKFHSYPKLFRSPGRINLIGEHIDYNGGWVMPAAIDKEVTFCIAPNNSATYQLYSMNLEEQIRVDQDDFLEVKAEWAKYIIGVIDQFHKRGLNIPGFDAVIDGDIPFGAGLSSSAALECATAFAINETFDLELNKVDLVQMAQKAENEFVGVNCGIMDQFASVFSKKNHVISLDCQTLSFEYFPLNLGNYELILVDSKVKHSLGSTAYNVRREECESALSKLGNSIGKNLSFRDLNRDQILSHMDFLTKEESKRALFVVEEITRVKLAGEYLLKGDVARLGSLLFQCHEGLQFQYEVSCKELDFLVEFARKFDGVAGARMMGGGFGGCTLNLVETEKAELFAQEITRAYQAEFGIQPEIIRVKTADGSSEVSKQMVVKD